MGKFDSASTWGGCDWLSSRPTRALFLPLLSCQVRMSQISSRLFLPASSNESPDERCGDTAGRGSLTQTCTRIHKYSCFLGFFLSKHTCTRVLCCGQITHLRYRVANSARDKDGGDQISIVTRAHTGKHTHKMYDSPGKGPGVSVSQSPK